MGMEWAQERLRGSRSPRDRVEGIRRWHRTRSQQGIAGEPIGQVGSIGQGDTILLLGRLDTTFRVGT